jgi:hypothetical protein
MHNNILFISLIILLNACQSKTKKIEQIDFNSEYKFSHEIETQVKNDTIPWKYQISAADYAKKGDYRGALIHWDSAISIQNRSFSNKEIDSIQQEYTIINAKQYIIEKAQNHQILIINEAHHNSQHRFFTKSLLKSLYNEGYKNLGLEALNNGRHLDSALNKRGYPIQKTGYYIQDPQFGNMIREALEIGYHIFAYEDTSSVFGKKREIWQAESIKKLIDKKPNEKFLIHCGFDHAMEGKYKPWEMAMAERLKKLTGLDPLTVNQEFFHEKSDPKFNHPLLKAIDFHEPSVLINKENKPLGHERKDAWTDIAVLHPETSYMDHRPSWLFSNDNEKVLVEIPKINLELPIMLMAFKKGEDINKAVPVDIVEMIDKNQKYSLALPVGSYELIYTDGNKSFRTEKYVKE